MREPLKMDVSSAEGLGNWRKNCEGRDLGSFRVSGSCGVLGEIYSTSQLLTCFLCDTCLINDPHLPLPPLTYHGNGVSV